jgi:antitoxin ParD1/3/4
LVIIPNIGIFIKNNFVMSKNTSITLGNYFDQFIQGILKEGRYKNTSEAVRAGLRLLEEEEQKIITLRNAIKEGVDSGIAEDFNPEEHLKMLKSKKK